MIFDLRRCAHARGQTSVDKPVRNRTFIGPAARLCSRAAPSFEQRLRTATGVAKLACTHRDSSSCVPHLACRRLGCCRSAGGKPGLRAGLRKLPVGAVYVGNFTAGAAGANCNDGDVSRASMRELEAMMISSKPRPFLTSRRPFTRYASLGAGPGHHVHGAPTGGDWNAALCRKRRLKRPIWRLWNAALSATLRLAEEL